MPGIRVIGTHAESSYAAAEIVDPVAPRLSAEASFQPSANSISRAPAGWGRRDRPIVSPAEHQQHDGNDRQKPLRHGAGDSLRVDAGRFQPYANPMTDTDRAVTRRAIADALMAGLERRHEVLDVIVGSADRDAAIDAITALLGTSRIGSEAVMGMSFDQLTTESRKRIASELDDLNSQLSFTARERPASSDESLRLRPFSHDTDRDIFATRTDEVGAAGDG